MLTSWDIFPASRTTWFIQCVLHHIRLQKLYFHSNFGAGNELLGSLSNHDDDFKKTILGLMIKTTALDVHHVF